MGDRDVGMGDRDASEQVIAMLVTGDRDESDSVIAIAWNLQLGAAHVLAQHPHARPRRSDRSLAPLVHAAKRRAREAFRAVYRAFVDAFRAAAERVRQGETPVEFPLYAFPPAAPFVGDRRAASPP